jgi:hypothetical protein
MKCHSRCLCMVAIPSVSKGGGLCHRQPGLASVNTNTPSKMWYPTFRGGWEMNGKILTHWVDMMRWFDGEECCCWSRDESAEYRTANGITGLHGTEDESWRRDTCRRSPRTSKWSVILTSWIPEFLVSYASKLFCSLGRLIVLLVGKRRERRRIVSLWDEVAVSLGFKVNYRRPSLDIDLDKTNIQLWPILMIQPCWHLSRDGRPFSKRTATHAVADGHSWQRAWWSLWTIVHMNS